MKCIFIFFPTDKGVMKLHIEQILQDYPKFYRKKNPSNNLNNVNSKIIVLAIIVMIMMNIVIKIMLMTMIYSTIRPVSSSPSV